MRKKNCIVLLGIVFLSFTYADSLSDLLDNAKNSYLNNDVSKTLEYLNTAKNELEKITFATNVSEYETVEYNRLRNFPSRYKGKKIKLQHTFLFPTGIEREKKMNGNYYPIWVSIVYNKIYEYIKKDYRTDKIQYIAKIVSLEQLTYDLFKEEPETTGVIWFE